MKLKNFLVVFLTSMLFVSSSFAASDTYKGKVEHKIGKKIDWLFVVSSQKAAITKTAKGFILTLRGVDPGTLFFSDRPVRKAGLMPTLSLLKNWKKGFAQVPPNAAMAHMEMIRGGKEVQPIAFELTNPIMKNHTLQFTIKAISNQKLPVGNFGQTKLFIDYCGPCNNFGASCWSGGVDDCG